MFQCGSAAEARCIPMASLCDSKRDCADFSDEKDDVCPRFCELASPKGLRFSCMVTVGDSTKAQCLNSRMKCDGKVQCTGESEDRNDESDCEGVRLNIGYFSEIGIVVQIVVCCDCCYFPVPAPPVFVYVDVLSAVFTHMTSKIYRSFLSNIRTLPSSLIAQAFHVL